MVEMWTNFVIYGLDPFLFNFLVNELFLELLLQKKKFWEKTFLGKNVINQLLTLKLTKN